jgi:hypothetical protein
VADPVVDRREVVQVEDDERQAALVALGASDFASERLVEVAAVVEAGERVEIGKLACFAKAAGVVDRRPARSASSSSSAAPAGPYSSRPDREYAER